MVDLSGGGTRVLLVGVAEHDPGSRLAPLPSVEWSVAELARVLAARCGIDPTRIETLVNPRSPIELGEAIDRCASQARDAFVLWYVGHGLLSIGNELHLATWSTLGPETDYRSLPYADVRERLTRTCNAGSLVVVLDTCHAGVGTMGPQAWPGQRQGAAAGVAGRGSFVLAAAAADERALAPPDQRHTAFTEVVLRWLTDGDPEAGPQLTLNRLAQTAVRALRPERGFPRPVRSSTGEIGDLVLADNPAYLGPTAGSDPARVAHEGGVGPGGSPPPGGPVSANDAVLPFPGLRCFGVDDARYFRGRGPQIASLVRRVDHHGGQGGPLLVVGASGSGKSSLVRAGLIPALSAGAAGAGASASWLTELITPGARPLTALTGAITGTDDGGGLPAELADVTDGPTAVAAVRWALGLTDAAARTAGDRFLLVVDQFEELFTLCQDADERTAFMAALAALARPGREPTPPVAVVVAVVRADFLDQALAYPAFADALPLAEVVSAMPASAVREAIEVPAGLAGLGLEGGLVETMLMNFGVAGGRDYDPGALPLLAHALYETWRRRDGQTLTLRGYIATGGVDGAISRTAEASYGRLDPNAQNAARTILVRLVRLPEYSRLRLDLDTLFAGLPHRPAADRALSTLVEARLLTVTTDSVEITHEALLRSWPRLQEWLATVGPREQLIQEIEDAARRWTTSGPQGGDGVGRRLLVSMTVRLPRRPVRWVRRALFRGPQGTRGRAMLRDTELLYSRRRLDLVEDRLPDGAALSGPARRFLAQSRRQVVRIRRRRRAAVGALAAALVVTVVAASFAWALRGAAIDRQKGEAAGRLVSQAREIGARDAPLALRLNIAAERLHASADSRTGIVSTLATTGLAGTVGGDSTSRPPAELTAVVTLSGGTAVATGGTDGVIRVWDTTNPAAAPDPLRLTPGIGPIEALAYAPDRNLLAVAGTKGPVKILQIRLGGKPGDVTSLPAGSAGATALSFAPDGTMLATASAHGTVNLWNLIDASAQEPHVLKTGDTTEVNALAWDTPDGTRLAAVTSAPDSGTDGARVVVWRSANGWRTTSGASISGYDTITAAAFSPTDHLLAVGLVDGKIRLIDASDPTNLNELPRALTGHRDAIRGLQFPRKARNGTAMLVSTGDDRTLRRWDVSDPGSTEPIGEPLTGHDGAARGLALNDLGTIATTVGRDGLALLWNLDQAGSPRQLGELDDRRAAVSAYSPASPIMVSAADRGGTVWSTRDPAAPSRLAPLGSDLPGPFRSVAISASGRRVAAVTGDKTAHVWDLTDLATPQPVATVAGLVATSWAVALSPDGNTLVATYGAAFHAWDVSQPGRPVALGEQVLVDRGTMPYVYTAAFSHDGATLAVGSSDHRIRLYHMQRGQPPVSLGPAISSPTITGSVINLAFSPDGILAVTSGNRVVTLWDVTTPQKPRERGHPLVRHTNGVSAVAFAPSGGSLLASAGYDGLVLLWDLHDPRDLPTVALEVGNIDDALRTVSFTSDGSALTTTGEKGSTTWDLRAVTRLWRDPAAYACSVVGGVGLSAAEWKYYLPDLDYKPTCSH